MNSKLSLLPLKDAAECLGRSQAWVYAYCQEYQIPLFTQGEQLCIHHQGAKQLFQFQFKNEIITFQILKGGTGKTSLVFEFAKRAHLYGARVLCVDLDSQGNLTQALQQNPENTPVMIDCLTEGYSISDAILSVEPGLDVLPSRIENALLDEALRVQKHSLDTVYREIFTKLQPHYDLIVLDCPPSLGQSVVAAALASDLIVSPTTPDKFSLAGLELTHKSLEELRNSFSKNLMHKIVLNKFEPLDPRSQEIWQWLTQHPSYQTYFLPQPIRFSKAFPQASLMGKSVFAGLEGFENHELGLEQVLELDFELAKTDLNYLTLTLLGIPVRTPFLLVQSSPKHRVMQFAI